MCNYKNSSITIIHLSVIIITIMPYIHEVNQNNTIFSVVEVYFQVRYNVGMSDIDNFVCIVKQHTVSQLLF